VAKDLFGTTAPVQHRPPRINHQDGIGTLFEKKSARIGCHAYPLRKLPHPLAHKLPGCGICSGTGGKGPDAQADDQFGLRGIDSHAHDKDIAASHPKIKLRDRIDGPLPIAARHHPRSGDTPFAGLGQPRGTRCGRLSPAR